MAGEIEGCTGKYKFCGASVDCLYEKFDDVFEQVFDEDLWVTKKTYRHSEPGLSYKYKYALGEFESDDGKVELALYMALLPESLCKSKRADLAKSSGVDEKDLSVADVVWYGGQCVIFGSEAVDNTEETIRTVKDTVASCLFAFDGMYGFWMDRYVNRIGTTGWDIVKEAKGRIKDAIKSGMRRWRRYLKEVK